MVHNKRKFNRVKNRIKNGVARPGDRETFIKLSKQLGYKNYLKEVESHANTNI